MRRSSHERGAELIGWSLLEAREPEHRVDARWSARLVHENSKAWLTLVRYRPGLLKTGRDVLGNQLIVGRELKLVVVGHERNRHRLPRQPFERQALIDVPPQEPVEEVPLPRREAASRE